MGATDSNKGSRPFKSNHVPDLVRRDPLSKSANPKPSKGSLDWGTSGPTPADAQAADVRRGDERANLVARATQRRGTQRMVLGLKNPPGRAVASSREACFEITKLFAVGWVAADVPFEDSPLLIKVP
jgi:hypothetical protein